MRGDRLRLWPRIALAGAFALGLAGCSDVDEALFGPYPNQSGGAAQTADNGQTAEPSGAQPAQPAAGETAQANPPAAAQPGAQAESAPAASSDQSASAEAAPPSTAATAPPPAEAAESAPAPEAEARGEAPSSEVAENNAATLPGTLPPVAGSSMGTMSFAPSDVSATIAPIRISAGRDTGTAVGRTVAGLRGEISNLNTKLMASAARLKNLRDASARATSAYQELRAKIAAHLQIGTTRANPELVAQWNAAQNDLDQLSANLNAMGALGTEVTNDFTSTRQGLQQITAAYDLPGAVDDDHRQLNVLEDETRQMIVSYDRLRKDVMSDVPRQTAFIANERAGLAQLAGAIKRGELYSSAGSVESATLPQRFAEVSEPASDKPLVVITFDHPDVAYEQILFAALKEALKVKPEASFRVVGVAPAGGKATKLAGETKRHAEDVLHSIAEMGVPASRLQIASRTDPAAQQSEVRVFVV